jgi:circadian clock protein KaiC
MPDTTDERVGELPRISTGISGLDNILHGGLPKDRIYLVEGDPGTGKTTLAMQFVLSGIRNGGRALYISLSETEQELRAMGDSHGWVLDGLDIFEMIPVEANLSGENQYSFFHPEEIELGETIRTIVDRVSSTDPTHIVIDSLSELRLLALDPRRYRRQVLALKHYFSGKHSTVLFLDDRTSEIAERQLHSIVHGVLSLQRLPRDYGKNRRRIEISKIRGSDYIDGFHDYVIERGGLNIFPRLQASLHHTPFESTMIASGVPNLDRLLGGGLDQGSATLLVGPAGCGKTTLAMKYALAATRRGERAAMYVFDEGLGSLLDRSEGLNLGLQQQIDERRVTVHQVDPAEMAPGEFAWKVRRSVEVDKARVVVIDSLNGYLTGMPQEQFLTLQMHELLTYLNQNGVVTILILAQHGALGQFGSSIDLSYLADTIVLLRFFEARGEIRRAISVIKKRSTSHELTIREMQIGPPEGVRVGDPLTDFRGILTGVPEFTGKVEALFTDSDAIRINEPGK